MARTIRAFANPRTDTASSSGLTWPAWSRLLVNLTAGVPRPIAVPVTFLMWLEPHRPIYCRPMSGYGFEGSFVVDRAEGNPLYLMELCGAVAEVGGSELGSHG